METLLWISAGFIAYTYAGYPLILCALTLFKRQKIHKATITPTVSVVIAAFNEERAIAKRIENLLGQEYPAAKMEIVVVSDGSIDATEKIVSKYASQGVKLIALPSHSGKAVALNKGVETAVGKIVVFADARQAYERDAVAKLIANFADPSIGAVSGLLVLRPPTGTGIAKGVGAYWGYEVLVRKLETSTGSMVGATGAIYAIRRERFQPIPVATILDDVLVPLRIASQGGRVVLEMEAVAYDDLPIEESRELRRKIRTMTGNFQLIGLAPEMFTLRNKILWRFVSHKALRLFVPLILITALVVNAVLWKEHGILLTMQTLFYSAATIGLIRKLKAKIFCIPSSFVLLNYAVLLGMLNFLSGKKNVWTKS